MPVTVKEKKKQGGDWKTHYAWMPLSQLSSSKPHNRDLLLLLSKKSHCIFFLFGPLASDELV